MQLLALRVVMGTLAVLMLTGMQSHLVSHVFGHAVTAVSVAIGG